VREHASTNTNNPHLHSQPHPAPHRSTSTKAPSLNYTQIEKLEQACKESVMMVHQNHLDTVIVPPGWAHAVTNRQACFKLAFDRVTFQDMLNVTVARETLTLPFFARRMPPDYTRTINKAAAYVIQTWHSNMYRG